MDDLRLRELEIRVHLDGDPARVSWHGISDHPEVGAELSPYLDQLAGSVDGVAIEVDFTAMVYMNSATIAPIVRFVRALDARCSRVSVIYDAKRTFQRTTFSAIKALGIVLRRLEVRARD